MTLQKKATLVSTTVAFLLSIIKLIAGILSGNLALLASAIDSILDMFVSIFNYFAIVTSEKQEDKDFNYGRGKIEALASLLEGLIITFSGIFLLYKAYEKYIKNEKSLYLNESLIIMIISLFATIFLVLYLNKVAKITKSMVIKADAMHYKVDVYSNLAVLLSLILVSLTSYEIIDV
ncbi:MAG: cation diffusion facilitator family transporter, partial [Campylobacteraceae bacterium]|nr:cation diffusion facilitator family transporter [Campylobacteraceae bacterium]